MGNSSKRKRPGYGESEAAAYSGVSSFKLIEPVDGPRTPHSFFKESYSVAINTSKFENEQTKTDDDDRNNKIQTQIVHRHVNGLCIVTLGHSVVAPNNNHNIKSIEFLTKEAPPSSTGEKRKRQAKMLKGGSVDNTVTPTTIIAQLKCSKSVGNDDEEEISIPVYSCVWGTILELNHSITPEVIADDPLLDGYLAIILPSGDFPPRNHNAAKTKAGEKGEEEEERNDTEAPEKKKLKADV